MIFEALIKTINFELAFATMQKLPQQVFTYVLTNHRKSAHQFALLLLTSACSSLLLAEIDTTLTEIDTTIENIIVTATHSPREAAGLPLSWSALDDADLRVVEHVHINESFQRIAGGWISRGNGQESLTALRSPVLTGAGSCGAFLVAADGISLRAPGFCNVNQLFDANSEQAQRIEVLKGPGTALYGSGGMHGVINVLSIDPAITQHDIGIEAGPHGYARGKYRYSHTVAKHGFAVALNAANDNGYKDDASFWQQKGTLRYKYSGSRFISDTIFSASNLDQDTAGFVQGYKAYQEADRKKENPNPEAYRQAWSARLQSTISVKPSECNTLTFIPYWRKNKMVFLQHFLPWQPVETNGHESVGLSSRWYHNNAWMDIASGVDLERTDGWLLEEQEQPFRPHLPQGIHYDYQVDATLVSIWSQLDWGAGARLNGSVGARYEYTHYDYNNQTEGSACDPGVSTCRFYRPTDSKDDFSNWSLNLGLLYDLNQSDAVYVRASQGFRAPQATELYRLQAGQQFADLDSEQLRSVDLGLRGIRSKFRYEMGAYYTEKKAVIFQDSGRQNVSGASTLHYGIDISLRWQLAETFDLALDINFARHEYSSDTQLFGSSGNIKGNDIDTAPRRFGSFRAGWQVRPGHRMELEWLHMDRYYLEPNNQHIYGGHDLLNLRLMSQLTPKFRAGLRITNLTDADYAERADFGFGNYRYFVGEPRSLYVQLSYVLTKIRTSNI